MPRRTTPLVTDHYYHLFNRGIDRRTTFSYRREYQRALKCMSYYQYQSPQLKLSRFLSLSEKDKQQFLKELRKQDKLVNLVAYVLMPNHFHFLVKQRLEEGISKFMANFQNSYTKYFNTSHKRTGGLFQSQFKAILLETDEQLLHLSRYIHLNPYTSFIIKTIKELFNYEWSSLPEYLVQKQGFCNKQIILKQFKGKDDYREFIQDQASYQRELECIKHLTFEE